MVTNATFISSSIFIQIASSYQLFISEELQRGGWKKITYKLQWRGFMLLCIFSLINVTILFNDFFLDGLVIEGHLLPLTFMCCCLGVQKQGKHTTPDTPLKNTNAHQSKGQFSPQPFHVQIIFLGWMEDVWSLKDVIGFLLTEGNAPLTAFRLKSCRKLKIC